MRAIAADVSGWIIGNGGVYTHDDVEDPAVHAPLGLDGEFTVSGLYELRDTGRGLERVVKTFRVRLQPSDSALSVLCEAAKAHKVAFGGHGDHVFFESLEVDGDVIELGMGS